MMPEMSEEWVGFGPDATFSAIANWLTKNVDLIDDQFSSLLKITQIRVGERMSTAHPRIPEQYIAPSWQLDFLSGSASDYRSEHGPRTRKRLEPIGQEWQDQA